VAAKKAADEANAAKDRFLATLSHELRTPLTPILLSARILELRPDDRDTVLGRAEVIRRSVETEVRLIDDLLDLTRISRDKLGLVAAPVSLHEVALKAVEVCRDDAQAAQVTVTLDLARTGRPDARRRAAAAADPVEPAQERDQVQSGGGDRHAVERQSGPAVDPLHGA
jgi:signal transduction histidine kinase